MDKEKQGKEYLMGIADGSEELDAKLLARQAGDCMESLLAVAELRPGEIVVLGCSTSEVCGRKIGSFSSMEAAEAMLEPFLRPCRESGLFLAIQCCEHLNRALVVERACAERYGLEQVNVLPVRKAGGAMATTAKARFQDPVVVESIRAHAGIDVGDTIIGMHLRPVVVPVRSQQKKIGDANVVMARTRAKYIGGPRAQYAE